MSTNNNDIRKKRRRKKGVKIVLLTAALAGAALFYVSSRSTGNAAIPVYTDKVFVGDIKKELNTSGNVAAENSKTFFAPADVRIEGIDVSKGDVVKAGDILICFDADAVAYAKRQSEIDSRISSADYNSNVQYNNEQQLKLEQAEAEIVRYETMIDNYEQYVDDLTNGITDVTALKKADLYARIYSVEKEINSYDLALQTPNEYTDMEAILSKKTEKQNELNKLNNELNLLADYKTDYGWEELLTQAKKDLADCEEKLQEAKSAKASAEAAIVNGSKLAGYQLNREKSQLTDADIGKKYEAALNGIVAEFDGIVTDVSVVEGAPVQEGTRLMVLESCNEVCVDFQASKYDLELLAVGQPVEVTVSGRSYQGTVSKINRMAEENSSGVPMVGVKVHINNPDDNIYLGIEAKLKILTASETNVLLVPVEAVNIDNTGEFCYIIQDGILVKRYVTTGISSEEYIQIMEGLSEGDEVVTSAYGGMDIMEGMAVMSMSGDANALTETIAENE